MRAGRRTPAALLALALLAGGCAEQQGPPAVLAEPIGEARFDLSGVSVRIGTAQEQALGTSTSYLIEILEGWGAEVELITLTNLSGLEAMVAGQIDVAARSSDELVTGTARGMSVRAIGEPVSAMHYALVAADGIGSVAELSGARVAVSGPGGFDTFLLRHLLTEQGMDPDTDVRLMPIGGSTERTATLIAGQADASIVFADNWIALEQRGADLQLVGYAADLVPGLSSRTYYAESSYLDANPEVADAIACANLEANQAIGAGRDAFIRFTLDNVQGTSENDVARFYDLAAELDMYPTDPEQVLVPDGYASLAELMASTGAVEQPVSADDFVDRGPLERAAAAGCGQDGD
ncbi:ABC transporter substrate-binding protein [Allonocardiopsis opalescens]|uniref:NitT/TauT family transport system substrate-binding protein n=1 Tax=Allonocardiopsis opalescens TaxID=1144618 RepID=A0A2T0QEA1_9ACTN|nr:ABC transporter substrate-binding protein [Allonocardiopsis opalescens]PRY02274.1 NitT/TauT family transport system substrate-binding protein [Allonocardiopsis opalescens]